MSDFKEYATKADSLARETFNDYYKAAEQMKTAETMIRKYPRRTGFGITPEYQKASLAAEAAMVNAKKSMEDVKDRFEKTKGELSNIRKNLKADIENTFGAKPEDIDNNAIALLERTALSPREYENLIKNANPTMQRVIASYASKAAEEHRTPEGALNAEGKLLYDLGSSYGSSAGNEYLQKYDVIMDAFDKCSRNYPMISDWVSLMGKYIEDF